MEKILTLQVTIFLLVAAGFAVKRLGMIGPQGQKNMNDLVIYVILPCNILHAFMSSPVEGRLGYYLEVLLISHRDSGILCIIWKDCFSGGAGGKE